MTLSNRKIVEEILPKTFAKVIYRGAEGVIASAPGTSTVAMLGGADDELYQYAMHGGYEIEFNEETPATVFLQFTADPAYSRVILGHKHTTENGDDFQDLVTAACLSSPEAALYLVKHGGLLTENYPQAAYEDPAFCQAAVEFYIPRIRHVPEKNLTPELYLSAMVGNSELYNDIDDGHIPLAPLAKAEFAKAVFAKRLPGKVMEILKEVFDEHASIFVNAAKNEAWLRAVPAELHGWSPAVGAAVNKLG